MPGVPAVFLDRDGTIIADQDYPGDADRVALLPGAAAAVARFNQAGLPVLVVTNQSGIGRGFITEAQFRSVQARMERLLEAEGARLGETLFCPHSPDRSPPCACRKPATGLYLQAARDRGIDLARSLYIGDRLRDVLPGLELGGTTFLIEGTEPASVASPPEGVRVVASLAEAADLALAGSRSD
jgi:histidinol-phosphate phosphatase family protein